MKKLFSVLFFILPSAFVVAQESEDNDTPSDTYKYFIASNSGVINTPIGIRMGVFERMGGYIGLRFGKGYKYEGDAFSPVKATEATLFSGTAGFIFPIAAKSTFKVHSFVGIGYGKWFDRPSKSGQTVGGEVEGGFILSYRRFMMSLGGNFLSGDGNSPKGDMTVGVGIRL